MNRKEREKAKAVLENRVGILFLVVFTLFSILLIRLAVLQIMFGEEYTEEVNKTEHSIVSFSVPRGKIYDRNNQVIVDNKALAAITYTRGLGVGNEEILDAAKKLAGMITVDPKRVTERDKKDYWLLTRKKEAEEKLTEEDWKNFEAKKLTNSDLYKLQLDRITDKDLEQISEDEMKVIAIYREMSSGYALTPQIVKSDSLTNTSFIKEYAMVSEHLSEMTGVDTSADWKRENEIGTLNSVLGKVTTSDEGLPREKIDYYLARGYKRNDRVGKSYLELQYEDVLRGQSKKVKKVTHKNSVIEQVVLDEGQRGNDLILSIDMELQREVEKIIEEEVRIAKEKKGGHLIDRAFVVMMDPNTGELLTMAGKKVSKDKEGELVFYDYALGAMSSAYEMGSAVKGATVLTGYNTGVINHGTYLLDTPIKLLQTPIKKSHVTMGRINDLTALEWSSNVYMFRIAMMVGGGHYTYNGPLRLKDDAFSVMRNHFNQFGLGIKTGIDLPNESSGFPGQAEHSGLLLDFAIGQYDTYTPLQMAQYISTIANGGYRLQPQIVREIRKPAVDAPDGPIIKDFKPNVLNRIDMSKEDIERVQKGLHLVMHGSRGTARSLFKNAPYNPAGKTGTAQAKYYGDDKRYYGKADTHNLTLVGYAPYEKPEVAFSVVVPWAYHVGNGYSYSINNQIGKKILDKYFEIKDRHLNSDTVNGVETPNLEEVDSEFVESDDEVQVVNGEGNGNSGL